MKLAQAIVELCKPEVGVEEIDGTNCGPRVDIYKAATNLPPHEGWPWCAAFICYIVREAMLKCGGQFTFTRPTTAAAWGFEKWSLAQDGSTQTAKPHNGDIKAGDIVMFTFSHVGFAVEDAKDGYVITIEGNTDAEGSREGGGVFKKRRSLNRIRSRVRFTV